MGIRPRWYQHLPLPPPSPLQHHSPLPLWWPGLQLPPGPWRRDVVLPLPPPASASSTSVVPTPPSSSSFSPSTSLSPSPVVARITTTPGPLEERWSYASPSPSQCLFDLGGTNTSLFLLLLPFNITLPFPCGGQDYNYPRAPGGEMELCLSLPQPVPLRPRWYQHLPLPPPSPL